MLTYVWEAGFDEDLAWIESCPIASDALMRKIESGCRKAVECGAHGYCLLRLRWKSNKLIGWYLVTGSMVTLLSLQVDVALAA
jgi:hypothetical protein